ncbi:hypothetical protein KC347_g261 [Hortaea werneckii]|nr:hypothetical protein KC347_g261 [Hortaea werneckii]
MRVPTAHYLVLLTLPLSNRLAPPQTITLQLKGSGLAGLRPSETAFLLFREGVSKTRLDVASRLTCVWPPSYRVTQSIPSQPSQSLRNHSCSSSASLALSALMQKREAVLPRNRNSWNTTATSGKCFSGDGPLNNATRDDLVIVVPLGHSFFFVLAAVHTWFIVDGGASRTTLSRVNHTGPLAPLQDNQNNSQMSGALRRSGRGRSAWLICLSPSGDNKCFSERTESASADEVPMNLPVIHESPSGGCFRYVGISHWPGLQEQAIGIQR